MKKLEEMLDMYDNTLIESLRRKISPIGSTLYIGEHVWDKVCIFENNKFNQEPESVPLDSIFKITDREKVYHIKINPEHLEGVSTFQDISKLPATYVSPKKNRKILKAKVVRSDYGGSAGNAAIAHRAFLDYTLFRIERCKHEDKSKILHQLKSLNVLYSGIDSKKNGFKKYYEQQGIICKGLKSSLMVCPRDYQIPINFIFELQGKKVLQGPRNEFEQSKEGFYEQLSRTNMRDIGAVFLDGAKHPYLLQETLKLFKQENITKIGAFTKSSLDINQDLILNRLLPQLEVLVENREEVKHITKKGLYSGLDILAKKNNSPELTIFTTLDKQGIMASEYLKGERIHETSSSPLEYAGVNAKEYTGAGDTATGVAIAAHLLGFPVERSIELANLFAQYRIGFIGNHTFASHLKKEIEFNQNLGLYNYPIDKSR